MVQEAINRLLQWDQVMSVDSVPATLHEYWLLKLTPLLYDAQLPAELRGQFRQYDLRRVLAWLAAPGPAFGADPIRTRDELVLKALEQALAALEQAHGADQTKWRWGALHRATFEHPLLAPSTAALAGIAPVERGGNAHTVQMTTGATETNAEVTGGASAMLVLDVQDWDRSVALNTPGNESQLGSPHYADLAKRWGDGKHFPLAFSRSKVEEVASERLRLLPR